MRIRLRGVNRRVVTIGYRVRSPKTRERVDRAIGS
jgi:hypothetical protein